MVCLPFQQEFVKIGGMQWQQLHTINPLLDTHAPEILLLHQALTANLTLVPSWIALEDGEENTPWVQFSEHTTYLLRPPFQGGETLQRRPEGLSAEELLKSPVQNLSLLQVLPASILQEGWLLLDPEYNQDLCLLYTATEAIEQILPQIPLWQAQLQAKDLQARLQYLSAQVRAELSWAKLRLYWLNTPEQLYLLMISPEEGWPQMGRQWRDFSTLESLPTYPEPLLYTLLEDISEDIYAYWCKDLAPAWAPQVGQYNPALLGHQGRLWYNQHVLTQLRQAIAHLNPLQVIHMQRRHTQRLKREQTWFLEGFSVLHAGLVGFCRHMASIYTSLIGYSLISELLLEHARLRLEQWGVFSALQQTHLNPLSRMVSELKILREQAQRLLLDKPKLQAEQLPQQRAFRQPWQIFLAQFGHRSYQELSLRSPRLSEAPEALLNSLLQPWQVSQSIPSGSLKILLLRPYWRWVASLLDAYIHFRSDGLWALYQLKKQLHARLLTCVKDKQLTHPDDFWFLTLEEVQWLEHGEKIPVDFLQQRREQWQSRQTCLPMSSDNFPSYLQGRDIFKPMREGVLWCPSSPTELLPAEMKPWQTILVLKCLEPGHYPQLLQVAAVVLAQDHDLNGGLSLLREWGIPAIFGLGEAIQYLRTGQRVKLEGEILHLL